MNLLIYSPQADHDESELLHVTRHHNVEIVRTPEELISRFSQPPCDQVESIVILLISGMAELKKFIEAREYFSNKALILILPEEESDLILMGFRLRVRYMGFRRGTFEDVAAVIARIQARIMRTQNINQLQFPERQIIKED
jgi:hypothetical protein